MKHRCNNNETASELVNSSLISGNPEEIIMWLIQLDVANSTHLQSNAM
jgi:hypothetical protein